MTALVKNFPKHMVSSMQQILPIVWNTLTESAALYPSRGCRGCVRAHAGVAPSCSCGLLGHPLSGSAVSTLGSHLPSLSVCNADSGSVSLLLVILM